jgi:hypothetical protein
MRRKLIKHEAFEQIANSSVTTVKHELVEAQGILARTLGKDYLKLHSFTESTVMYETLDDSYVHASFDLKNEQLTFQNIEELIIDHESKKAKIRDILGEMVDAIIVDNNTKADEAFQNFLTVSTFTEAKKPFFAKEKGDDDGDEKKGNPFGKKKGKFGEKKAKPFGKKKSKKDKADLFAKVKGAGKKLEEAYSVAENVLDYVSYMQLGPSLAEAVVNQDDNGNVTDLRIPVSKVRNENRVLSFDWKTLNSKVKNLREQALNLHGNQHFVRAMADLQRENAFSNSDALQKTLGHIAQAFPQALYATKSELTQIIGESLRIADVKNFDDQTCEFMAEAILTTAHGIYEERVNQILHLASAPKVAEGEDKFEHFCNVAEAFYVSVDEKFGLERKVFSDLYESLEDLYRTADHRQDNGLKQATARYLNELADVLNAEAQPDLELAEEVAGWLQNFVENSLEGSAWTVSNKPHITVTGEHPDMAKKATVDGIPGKYKGGWGDEAPMIGQDDMNYKGKHSKEARSNSWGNIGGKGTYPSLDNPYVPKPFGDWTMKGEKGVDKDAVGQHHSTWQSKDTWPKLQNPYIPKAETNKTYKMNKGKEKDLIVDK